MTFSFQELVTAVETYPETFLQIEIIDVDFTGNALNVNETASFRVQVTNTGALHITDLTVRVQGLNGATVKNSGAAAPFVSEFVSAPLDQINAHGGVQSHLGSPFSLKAPAGAQASKNLVKVTLEDWNADQSHIFIGHSDPLESVKATFAAAVVIS